MKFFTKPRVNAAALVRPGDQMAVTGRRAIDSESTFMDADLAGRVEWLAVHWVEPAGDGVTVRHNRGDTGFVAGAKVITREVIEIDPWSYVSRTGSTDNL